MVSLVHVCVLVSLALQPDVGASPRRPPPRPVSVPIVVYLHAYARMPDSDIRPALDRAAAAFAAAGIGIEWRHASADHWARCRLNEFTMLFLPADMTTRKAAIEGLAGEDGGLHPIQQAFMDCHGLQCGFCTPGIVMNALELVRRHPDPSEETVRAELDGNLCRCTGYHNIVKAVVAGAAAISADGNTLTIDQAGNGGPVPSGNAFDIDMGPGTGDSLVIMGATGNDVITFGSNGSNARYTIFPRPTFRDTITASPENVATWSSPTNAARVMSR